jgi:Spy/CpxP family protein refolding chaperone
MPFDPARLLARKDALGLSAQQVGRLTALENNTKPGMTAALQQIKTERAAIAAGLNADAPDTVQLKRHYEALQTAAGNAHWARVSTSLEARAVLSQEQRGKVRGWAELRGGRWRSKGHGSRL